MQETPTSKSSIFPKPQFSSNTSRWTVKLLIIFIALFIFQIPIYLIQNLSAERQVRHKTVHEDICKQWGGTQHVTLSIPAKNEMCTAHLNSKVLYRGIYQTVVYTADVSISAEYDLPEARNGYIHVNDIKNTKDWFVKINGKEVPVEKGIESFKFQLPAGNSHCDIFLTLNGSSKFEYTLNSAKNSFKLTGNWQSPGFIGLPAERNITDKGFTASWHNNDMNYASRTGVELCIPGGTYQQVERCINYSTFFLIVFFFSLVAAELLTKVRIHTLQYVIAAGAPVLFYLMTLAFSEKIGFTAGYIASAAVIVAMITMYARLFLGKTVPALILGAVIAAGYLCNFMVLRLEDCALLSGTIVLAIILGILMALTGKINRQPSDQN